MTPVPLDCTEGAPLLANGDFERGSVAWSTTDGARNGGTPRPSEVAFVPEGRGGSTALRLRGTPRTTLWSLVWSDPAPVSPGESLGICAAVRAEGVRVDGDQYDNAYVGLMFADAAGGRISASHGPVAVAGEVAGTTDWSAVRRRISVPEGAATVRAAVFLSKSGTMWVDDVVVRRVPSLAWQTTPTDRIVFHALPEAPVSQRAREQTLRNLSEIEASLGVALDVPVHYWRYPDRDAKGELTGNAGNGHASWTTVPEVHTIWPTDRHELVHLVLWRTGRPVPLLVEGIAVHLSGAWQGEPIDAYARRLRAGGELPDLATLADRGGWAATDSLLSYAAAGSFVGHLVRTRGMATFLRVYADPRARDALPDVLEATYGASLVDLEARWHAHLDR